MITVLCTIGQFNQNRKILKVGIPLAVIAVPFCQEINGEEPLSVIDYGDVNPLRCTRCQGYINSSVAWKEDGHFWICNLCSMKNETPPWYYCSLDGAGLRRDREAKMELTRGSVEFVVKKEDYCTRPAQEVQRNARYEKKVNNNFNYHFFFQPNFIFGIDISQHAVESGFTGAAISATRFLLAELREHCAFVDYRVGIYTFNSVGIHFFRVDTGRPELIKIFQVEIDDPCGPLPPSAW
jgi:protein transport protein SEC24